MLVTFSHKNLYWYVYVSRKINGNLKNRQGIRLIPSDPVKWKIYLMVVEVVPNVFPSLLHGVSADRWLYHRRMKPLSHLRTGESWVLTRLCFRVGKHHSSHWSYFVYASILPKAAPEARVLITQSPDVAQCCSMLLRKKSSRSMPGLSSLKFCRKWTSTVVWLSKWLHVGTMRRVSSWYVIWEKKHLATPPINNTNTACWHCRIPKCLGAPTVLSSSS